MALDYANILGNSQGLVPDMRAQLMQDAQIKAQQQQTALQGVEAQQKQVAFTRQQQFQRAVQVAVHSGDPRAISQLMIEYPEFAAQLKPGNDASNVAGQQRNLTQMGSIYTRAQAGDFAGAAKVLEGRIAADKAAGLDTADDEELLVGLKSPDPNQRKIAQATVGIHLSAAAGPDKFAETYGKVFSPDKTSPKMVEYNNRLTQFGKEAADKWLATEDLKLVPVQQGGSVFNAADFVPGAAQTAAPTTQTGGGGQTSTGASAVSGPEIEKRAKQIVPGVVITSGQRSAAHNKAVGGVSNSYHLTGQARDFTPPKGMSMGALRGNLAAAFPGYDVINEGDHVHIEPGPGMAAHGTQHGSGPVKVKSVQQANKLPAGTHYITPDGQEFVR